LAESRTHSLTPVLVFHFMPISWQLMQVMARTAACFMIVPAKLVNTVAVWHCSQAIAAVPLAGWRGYARGA